MPFDFLNGILSDFNDLSGIIPGGHDGVLNTVFPENNVLIWSDVNHANAGSLIGDLLSEERMRTLATHGVTDIYLEELEEKQPLYDAFAQGSISEKSFVERVLDISDSVHLTKEQQNIVMLDIARAITIGASMNPPIRLHAAQISDTAEQQETLDDLNNQIFSTHSKYLDLVDDFLDKFEAATSEDIDYLFSDQIGESFNGWSEELYDYSKIHEHFSGRMPDDVLNDYVAKFYGFKIEQQELEIQYMELNNQYRIDNDVLLADRVVQTKQVGDGKVVIVHGAGHGGQRTGQEDGNDLDELLRQRGLISTRVNVVYDEKDLNGDLAGADESEISYFPGADKVVYQDYNRDGLINGTEGVVLDGIDAPQRQIGGVHLGG